MLVGDQGRVGDASRSSTTHKGLRQCTLAPEQLHSFVMSFSLYPVMLKLPSVYNRSHFTRRAPSRAEGWSDVRSRPRPPAWSVLWWESPLARSGSKPSWCEALQDPEPAPGLFERCPLRNHPRLGGTFRTSPDGGVEGDVGAPSHWHGRKRSRRLLEMHTTPTNDRAREWMSGVSRECTDSTHRLLFIPGLSPASLRPSSDTQPHKCGGRPSLGCYEDGTHWQKESPSSLQGVKKKEETSFGGKQTKKHKVQLEVRRPQRTDPHTA